MSSTPAFSPIARARTIVLWVLTAEIALLVATGVLLYFRYTPLTASAWTGRVAHALALPLAVIGAVLTNSCGRTECASY